MITIFILCIAFVWCCITYLFSIEKNNMIKKILKGLLTIWIIWLWIINFSNAWYTRQVWVYGYNPYSPWYDVNFTRAWNPLTQNLWYTKQFFVISDWNYWWWYNWLPYFFLNFWWYSLQWIITEYNVCDEIFDIESSSWPWNCTTQNVWLDTSKILWNFLSSVKNTDYFYFNNSSNYNRPYTWYYVDFCISNQ